MFAQGNRFFIEMIIFSIELIERKSRREQGMNKVEEVIVMGDQLILHLFIEVGAGQRGKYRKAGETLAFAVFKSCLSKLFVSNILQNKYQ